MRYVNLTPRWTEILPMHRKLFEQVTHPIKPRAGINANYQVVRDNFWAEVERMAQGADNFNDLVAYLRNIEGWTDDAIQVGLEAGQRYQERERTTVKESV